MKNLKYLGLFSFFVSSAVFGQCTLLKHKDGDTHKIPTKLNAYTHIVLPENVMQGTKAIVGNSTLWNSDVAGPHIYIKPTNKGSLGKSTTLSVVGQSGKGYDFLVERHGKLKSACFKLVEGVVFDKSHKNALTANATKKSNSMELAMLWKDKYYQEKADNKKLVKDSVIEALRRYRYQIYTRYTWDEGEGFIGKNLVSDVYDDGRFTYIRVRNQNKGIMIVEAELSDQVEIVEAKFDSLNKMYTVSGIFPKFTLKYGESSLEIERYDNSTVGDY